MEIKFHKYHGTGNDFILIDNREKFFNADETTISGLCDRRFGIGADGLILLEQCPGFDFRMLYFNSDGRESTMCGNGGRCITAFADFLSLIPDHAKFIGPDGEHTGHIVSRNGTQSIVRLSLRNVNDIRLLNEDYILNTGSPHLVRFVKDVELIRVAEEGRKIRNLPDYQPAGINVNFVTVKEGKLHVRTYERGVEDETLSCGTGVTASAIAYAHRNEIQQGTVQIVARGGQLELDFRKNDKVFTDIFLQGPAARVFSGIIQI